MEQEAAKHHGNTDLRCRHGTREIRQTHGGGEPTVSGQTAKGRAGGEGEIRDQQSLPACCFAQTTDTAQEGKTRCQGMKNQIRSP